MVRKIRVMMGALCLVVLSAATVSAQGDEPSIGELLADPERYEEQLLTLSGTVDAVDGNDFMLSDGTGSVEVGSGPPRHHRLEMAAGESVTVTGQIEKVDRDGGIELESCRIARATETIDVRDCAFGGPPPWAGGKHKNKHKGKGKGPPWLRDDDDTDGPPWGHGKKKKHKGKGKGPPWLRDDDDSMSGPPWGHGKHKNKHKEKHKNKHKEKHKNKHKEKTKDKRKHKDKDKNGEEHQGMPPRTDEGESAQEAPPIELGPWLEYAGVRIAQQLRYLFP